MLGIGVNLWTPGRGLSIGTEVSPAGARFDAFSAANYFISSGAPASNLGLGQTIVMGWWSNDPTTDSTPWCAVGAGCGWFLDQNAAYLYLNLRNPGLRIGTVGIPVYGFNRVAITRKASGQIVGVLNGDSVQYQVAPAGTAYVDTDGTARELIGRCYAPVGTYAGTKVPPLWCAHLARELSDAERTDWTRTDVLDRWNPPAALVADPSLDLLYTAAAWDGVGNLAPVVGSQVLTRTGAPTRLALEPEIVYSFPGAYYHHSAPQTDPAGRSSFALLQGVTEAANVAASVGDDLGAMSGTFLQYREIGLRVNGVWSDELDCKYAGGNPQHVDAHPIAAGSKVISLTEGLRVKTAPGPVADGYPCAKVRVPLSTPVSWAKPIRPANRLVCLTDSTGEQIAGGVPARDAWTMLARANAAAFPMAVTATCFGGGSISSLFGTPADLAASVAYLLRLLDGTASNALWLALETNDYGLGLWGSLDDYQATRESVYDAIQTAAPAVIIYAATATPRTGEGTLVPPVTGFTLQQYRDRSHLAAVGRPWVVDVACEGWTIPTSDGLHYTAAGHVAYEAAERAIVGY